MKNKTLESIFKDIDVLGINGGYSVEQLLSPQDCRMLKSTIKELQDRINEAIEYINYATENNDIDELKEARHLLLFNEDLDKLLNILQGSDK